MIIGLSGCGKQKFLKYETGDSDRTGETWYCPECGQKNTGKYCSDCGIAKPEN